MDIEELKLLAARLEEEGKEDFEKVNQTIYDFAELGNQEFKSTAYLSQKLREIGFTVIEAYCGIPTAIRGEYGSGKPKIAFLAEYDALPGYGPDKNQNGHACGHNWISANCYGACAVLAKLKEHFQGTIVFMGAPAEETTGGKVDLVKAGAFDDIDLAMQIHITGGDETQLGNTTLAIDSVEFTFQGVAAHAAAFPERGVNALDGAYLTFNGINALRQHITDDARVHGIICQGGVAANITPNIAVAQFYVRAAKREYLDTLTQKVINCAKGAELMTGAKLSLRYFENSFDNHIQNPVLKDIMEESLYEAGEEKKFVSTQILPPNGSSDLGNVSHVCPTVYVSMAAHNGDNSNCHEEKFLPYCTGEVGFACLHKAIKAQVFTALTVFTNPEIQKKLK
ncbi:MAG: M20 family metallopeptidase [Oscillospiraceae bacterium]